MYERPSQRPLSRPRFARRVLGQLRYAAFLVVPSLALGMVIFRYIVREPWPAAFLNATMLLSGMGPVGDLDSGGTAGSIAAGLFALYSGLVFLIVAGLVFAPIFHRVLHRFHWDADQDRAR
jgi:hypothetical protein